MTLDEQKKAFAIGLLHNPDNPFEVAQSVFPDDPGMSLDVYGPWPEDDIVKAYQDDYIKSHGKNSTLPSKEKYARKVWAIAMDETQTLDDRLKALRLYGDINGMIEKPGTVINATTKVSNNKVMIVSHQGTQKEWEAALIENQRKLASAR